MSGQSAAASYAARNSSFCCNCSCGDMNVVYGRTDERRVAFNRVKSASPNAVVSIASESFASSVIVSSIDLGM